MSGIHRTKIDWSDASWNPVSGCLHDCPYCYARNMARRFQPKPSEWPEPNTVKAAAHDERCFIASKPTTLRDADGLYLRSTPYPRGFAPTMHTYKLDYLKTAKTPRRIFVGSMTDLFGDWVPDEWLAAVFRECYDATQHVYMFLTKNPERYLRLVEQGLLPEGDNYWWGVTVTNQEDYENKGKPMFHLPTDRHTFFSIEPIHGEINMGLMPDWMIIGAETGRRKNKMKPPRAWIESIVKQCADENVFMKESLTDIWGEPLLQEYPDAMMAHIGKGGGTDE